MLKPINRYKLNSVDFENSDNELFASQRILSLDTSETNGKIAENIPISSQICDNKLYLIIDKLFWNVVLQPIINVDGNITFDDTLDTFSCFKNTAVVGSSNGYLYSIDLSKMMIMDKCKLGDIVNIHPKSFVGIYLEQDDASWFVLTIGGKLFKITVDSNMLIHQQLITDFTCDIRCASYFNGKILAYSTKILLYDISENLLDEGEWNDLALQKIWPESKLVFLCLMGDNTLIRINTINLLYQNIDYTNVLDFSYYSKPKRSFIYHLVKDTSGKQILKLSYYKGEDMYVLKNDDEIVHLITNKEDDTNQLYVTKALSAIEVYQILETKPEDRLQRLINEGLFDDAEKYCLENGLDLLLINKAKLNVFMRKVACTDDDVDIIITLLNSIDDTTYKVDCCMNIQYPSIAAMEKLIYYAMDLELPKDSAKTSSNLSKLITRYNTFKTLKRCELEEVTMSSWQAFSNANLFELLIASLSKVRTNNMQSSIVLLINLEKKDFTETNINAILKYLDKYQYDLYISFLYQMIPNTLLHLPSMFSVFVEKFIGKIHCMEAHRRENEFPECAIDFLTKVIDILNNHLADHALVISGRINVDYKANMNKLLKVKNCLDTILELKNNYNIYLPLSTCLQGPGAMLVHSLNVNISCLETFLKEYLIKFMTANGFNADEIFISEIRKMTVEWEEKFWGLYIEPIWRCVNAVEMKLQVLLDILKLGKKPWSENIRKMINEAVKYNHPLVPAIEIEIRNEPSYIVFDKYAMSNMSVSSINKDVFFFKRMFKCKKPTIVEDISALILSDECRAEANFLLLVHFIKENAMTKALDLVRGLKPQEILQYIPRLINAFVLHREYRANILNVVRLMEKLAGDEIESSFALLNINYLKLFNDMPSEYQIAKVWNALKSNRVTVMRIIVDQLDEIYSVNGNFNEVMFRILKYAERLQLTPEVMLFEICKKTKDLSFMHSSALYMIKNGSDMKAMCLMTSMILKYAGLEANDLDGTLFNATVDEKDLIAFDNENRVHCLVAARRLMAKTLLLSDGEVGIIHLCNWASCATYMMGLRYQDCKASVNAINVIFELYADYVSAANDTVLEHLEYITFDGLINEENNFDVESKESFSTALTNKFKVLQPSIVSERNYWTMLKLISALEVSLYMRGDNKRISNTQDFLRLCVNKLVSKVLAAKTTDSDIAYTLLSFFPEKKRLTIINDALSAYRHNINKCEVIIETARRLSDFNAVMVDIKWWRALHGNYATTYKDFCDNFEEKKILGSLIKQGEINVDQITEFCNDYHLDPKTYYSTYLGNLISNWEPEFEIHTDSMGKRHLVLKNNEQCLVEKCLNVVTMIKDTESLLKYVNKLWNSSNVYYYEIYKALLSIIMYFNEDEKYTNYKVVLDFLQTYTRASKPSELEMEEWFSRFMGDNRIHQFSEFRFPFSPILFTQDIWKMLRHEINLCNYEKWFRLVKVLTHLDDTQICTYVIKDISLNVPCEKIVDEYNLRPQYENLFNQADKCIERITDPLVAASVALSLVIKTPEGADKVNACKLAFKYANNYKQSAQYENNAKYKNIIKLYRRYLSKHILVVNNLAIPKYFQLLDQPNELITALYHDDRILCMGKFRDNKCPNINKAVIELGEINGHVDVKAKRIQLLNSWLSDDNESIDQSVLFTAETDANLDDLETSIIRITYLCSGPDTEFWRDYLYKYAVTNPNKYLLQGKALKIFCNITPPEEVEERCKCKYQELLLTIEKFLLLSDMHTLCIPLTVEQLDSVPKVRLLKKLNKNISSSINLKAMVSVCKLYRIYDLAIWENIILEMIKQDMVPALRTCINFLRYRIPNIQKTFYIKAWQTIIDHLFTTLQDENQADRAKEHIYYVQSCPVLNRLDLLGVQHSCIKLKKFDLAALLLQYIPDNTRARMIKFILTHTEKNKLITDLRDLEYQGFVGTNIVLKELQSI